MIKKLTPAAGGQGEGKGAAEMMMRSSWLTGPELEAAHQLIQLSGDTHSSSRDGHSSAISGDLDDDVVIMRVAPSDIEAAAAAAVESCAEATRDQDMASTSSSLPSSSSSSSTSSSAIRTGANFAVWEEIDASCLFMMKRKRKFRSVADLYANNKPNLVKKAAS